MDKKGGAHVPDTNLFSYFPFLICFLHDINIIIIACVGHIYKSLATTLPEYFFLLMVMVRSSPISFPPLEITLVATVEVLSSNAQ